MSKRVIILIWNAILLILSIIVAVKSKDRGPQLRFIAAMISVGIFSLLLIAYVYAAFLKKSKK